MQQKINWQLHIKKWQASGLSKIEYCRQNQLNKFSFYEKSRKKENTGSMIELPFLASQYVAEKVPTFEIHFQIPFAVRIRFNLIFGNRS